MDIPKSRSSVKAKKYAIASGVGAVLLTLFFVFSMDLYTPRIEAESYQLYEAKTDDFVIDVLGTGRLLPRNPITISAPENGDIVAVKKRAGDEVGKNDVLFVLFNQELLDQRKLSENEFLAKKMQLSVSELEMAELESSYRGELSQAKASYLNSRLVFDAQKKLMELPAPPVSEIEFEKSKLDLELKNELYLSSQENLSNFKRMVKTKLELLNKEVDESENALERIKERVEGLEVKSEEAGIIQEINFEHGNRVQKGQAMAIVIDPSDVYIRLQVAVGDASKIVIGMPATLEIGGVIHTGVVERVSSSVRSSGIDLDIAIDALVGHPKINSYVSGRVFVEREENVVSIPKPRGVKEYGDGHIFVKTSSDSSYAERRQVRFGPSSSGRIVIADGVDLGETIVLFDPESKNVRSDRVRIN